MIPSLYISHGSLMTALIESPARRFLESLASLLPRPRAPSSSPSLVFCA
jgi:aromatic ring-opening dioxygenase catalytic subunit (LigB family)